MFFSVFEPCSCSDAFFLGLQGLLAVPFVLNSQPTAAYEEYDEVKSLQTMAQAVHRRYAEIMRDVEGLVNDHSRSHVSLPDILLVGDAVSDMGLYASTHTINIESAKVDSISSTASVSADNVQAQDAGTIDWILLHATAPRSSIHLPGQTARHLLSPLCRSLFQRRPAHPQHSPDHGPHATITLVQPHQPHSRQKRSHIKTHSPKHNPPTPHLRRRRNPLRRRRLPPPHQPRNPPADPLPLA